jgi:hypothetical protein
VQCNTTEAFNDWLFSRPSDETTILSGHSLWFRFLLKTYLPWSSTHKGKKEKLVNCGVVACTLQRGTTRSGAYVYHIDPASIQEMHVGFENKYGAKAKKNA